jgi:hypothetical protein
VNDGVHQIPVDDIRGLKYRTETTGSVDFDMLQNARLEKEYILDMIGVTDGAHVESIMLTGFLS